MALLLPRPIAAQTPASAAPPASRVTFDLGVAVTHDRSTWHFDNASSFDTAALVPHFFEQQYWSDHRWLRMDVGYRAGGMRWHTTVGVTAPIVARADDFDTFVQPSGDVVVSGTTGLASQRAWSVAQRASRGAGAVTWFVEYAWRRDRAGFHAGEKIVSHTAPPGHATSIVTTREFTTGDLQDVRVGIAARAALPRAWALRVDADASPVSVARLVVSLPDKYPGRALAFAALDWSAGARVALAREGVWRVAVGAEARAARGYRDTGSLDRDTLALVATFGRAW